MHAGNPSHTMQQDIYSFAPRVRRSVLDMVGGFRLGGEHSPGRQDGEDLKLKRAPSADWLYGLLSDSNWGFLKPQWLKVSHQIDDNQYLRKDSQFSVDSTATEATDIETDFCPCACCSDSATDSSDKTFSKSIWDSEAKPLYSAWRNLLKDTSIPKFHTWTEAQAALHAVIAGVKSGSTPIAEITAVIQSVCYCVGAPIVAKPGLEYGHVAVRYRLLRNAEMLVHSAALGRVPLNVFCENLEMRLADFAQSYQVTMMFYGEEVNDEIPAPHEKLNVLGRHGDKFAVDSEGNVVEAGSRSPIMVLRSDQGHDYTASLKNISCINRRLQSSTSAQEIVSRFHEVVEAHEVITIAPFHSLAEQAVKDGFDPWPAELMRNMLEARIEFFDMLLRVLELEDTNEDLSDSLCHDLKTAAAGLVHGLQQLSRYTPSKDWQCEFYPTPTLVVYSSTNALRGATRMSLIEQLTMHNQPINAQVLHTVFTTYSAYLSEEELFELFVKRYNISPASKMSPEMLSVWKMQVQFPVQIRVVNVLKVWVQQQWHIDNRELLSRIASFANTAMSDQVPGASKLADACAKPEVPKPVFTKAAPILHPVAGESLATPREIAMQLTLIKFQYYKALDHHSLLWRHTRQVTSPELSSYIEYCNQESAWAANLITEKDTPEDRACAIEALIEVAAEIRDLKNFSTLITLLSSFNTAPVHRLKKTWALVSEDHQQVLMELGQEMASTRNFSRYRSILTHAEGSCIPFIGLCLMDLRYTYDGNKDFLDDDKTIVNFAKWVLVEELLGNALRFQLSTFGIEENKQIQQRLIGEFANALPLNDQYNRSLEIEPREKPTPARSIDPASTAS